MKKLLLLSLILSVVPLAQAGPPWISSNTAVAVDVVQPLCTQARTSRHGMFHGICVNSVNASSGTISIFNSSSTAVSPVAVTLATQTVAGSACRYFDVYMSSGISWSVTGINDVTAMYECY